jgi:hypothetical protein
VIRQNEKGPPELAALFAWRYESTLVDFMHDGARAGIDQHHAIA